MGLLLAAGIAGYNLGGSCWIRKEKRYLRVSIHPPVSKNSDSREHVFGTGWPFRPHTGGTAASYRHTDTDKVLDW